MALIDLILVLAGPELQKLIGVPCQDSKKLIYSFKPLFWGGNHQPSAFSGRVLYVMRPQETFHSFPVITPESVGDLRHADAGYDPVIERARKNNLDLLQIL